MFGGTVFTVVVMIALVALGAVVIKVGLDQYRRTLCEADIAAYNTDVDARNMRNESAKGLKPLSEMCLAIGLRAKKPIAEPHEFKGCLDVYSEDLKAHPGEQRTLSTRADLSPSCKTFALFLFDDKTHPSGGQ